MKFNEVWVGKNIKQIIERGNLSFFSLWLNSKIKKSILTKCDPGMIV